MRCSVRWLSLVLAALLLPFALLGQAYTRIVVFGDSLSDTGNVAQLAQSKYGLRLPAPAFGYTDGRFTDGTDTLPPGTLYSGVWVEQLAASLAAKPQIKASLNGGTDYAYGDATTGTGTTTVGYGSSGFSLAVDNLGQQVSDYLATNPTINSGTLFIVWGGANDLLNATSAADITTAANNEITIVQRLIAAGATEIIVPNLPPLGATPRLNGNAMAAAQATAAAQAYNSGLFGGLQQLAASSAGKNVHLYPLDTYTLLNNVVATPANYKIDNAVAKAQFSVSANPDRYLFWDDIHPTTAGHALLAAAALKLITPVVVGTTTTLSSSNLSGNLNTAITLTAIVTAASGQPTGTVNFLEGTTTLGTATLSAGSATSATATLQIATLSAGTHSLTASYAGTSGFMPSTSAAISEVITAPALTTAASPTSLTITRGSSGTTTLTATPVGGYSGTVTFACGALPRNMTCSFAPASLTLNGNNTPQTSTLTIGTQSMSAVAQPPFAPATPRNVVAACSLFFLAGLARRRKSLQGNALQSLLACAILLAVAGLTGCGSDNRVSTGTYTVPVTATAGANTSTINLQVTVQ